MFKVLIWDNLGMSNDWLNQVADMKDIEVVDTLTPEKPASEILLKRDAWDWLLIFEQGARQFFDATIQTLKLPLDRIVYALDIGSWLQHPKAAFTLINPTASGGGYFIKSAFAHKPADEQFRHVHRRRAFVCRHGKRQRDYAEHVRRTR